MNFPRLMRCRRRLCNWVPGTGIQPGQHRPLWRREAKLELLLRSGVCPTQMCECDEDAQAFWTITAPTPVLSHCGRWRCMIQLLLFVGWLFIPRAARNANNVL